MHTLHQDLRIVHQPLKPQKTPYHLFADHLETLLAGSTAVRIESSGYMPLSVEKLPGIVGSHQVSLCHYGKQNGDLMRDPEMVFEVFPSGEAEPISFQNDYTPTYQEVYDYEEKTPGILGRSKVRPRLKTELRQFAAIWFKNLKAQGFFKPTAKRTLLAD